MFNILCWNVRGLNDPCKRRCVRSIVSNLFCSVVCIQESKVDSVSRSFLRSCCGSSFDRCHVIPAYRASGGLITCWNELGNICPQQARWSAFYVTHWTFANYEVRVIRRVLSFSRFSGGSLTVFRPMARVPRIVVQSLAPKPEKRDLTDSRIEFWRACIGTRLCLYRYKVDGCIGTAIGACTGTEPQSPATRASGLDFVDLVPVQELVYRYKGLISCSLNCRGFLRLWTSY
uniref:Endonuclease/exonuclease/phosphatase domain-containing protein n=1 Tax=Ananas comosus var. bracteatus TaxID=296719 RepID=A0A6V7P237_ANACO|nr:unnamed protein product [Ananas comosus var. bracteatus]